MLELKGIKTFPSGIVVMSDLYLNLSIKKHEVKFITDPQVLRFEVSWAGMVSN